MSGVEDVEVTQPCWWQITESTRAECLRLNELNSRYQPVAATGSIALNDSKVLIGAIQCLERVSALAISGRFTFESWTAARHRRSFCREPYHRSVN